MFEERTITNQEESRIRVLRDDRRRGVEQRIVVLYVDHASDLADYWRVFRDAELTPHRGGVNVRIEEPIQLHATVDRREVVRGGNPRLDCLLANDARDADVVVGDG